MIKKNTVIDYEPINFYGYILKNLSFTFLFVLICSLFVYYTMSSDDGMENFPLGISILIIVAFLLINFIRIIYPPNVFIFCLKPPAR